MEEKFPEATNLKYIKHEDIAEVKKIFVNNVNSYQGLAVIQKILSHNQLQPATDKVIYEVFGTTRQNEKEYHEISDVIILNSNDDSFLDSVLSCDIFVYDISQDWSETRKFLKHFEKELENSKIDKKKQMILISTIMTWAQTHQYDVALTDLSYKKRKPHPCYTNHLILERDVINLSKKFKDLVASIVVCPGIIYGEKQEVLHFLYKKCYFNNVQIDIFAPGTNYLPLIYIEDFKNIIMLLIRQFPDPSFPYILAVQPEPLQAKNVIATLAEAAGGPETRVKVSSREEIFLMDEELMTQRVFNHLTLNLRLESEFLRTFNFKITGSNFDQIGSNLANEFYNSRNLKPLKILIDGTPFAYQSEMAEMFASYYSLHQVQSEGFFENFSQRLAIKIKEAEDYLAHMSSLEESKKLYSDMIEKVESQVVDLKGKLDIISERLKSDTKLEFHEMQDFIINRLTSFGCAKHQGYVMQGFELDSEMASYLFLEPSDDGFEFNDITKPDYVILMNRLVDQDICAEMEQKLTISDRACCGENEMKIKLKDYHNSHYEDVSLHNFFLDRDIIPIEISFDRDQTRSDLLDIFESLKSKMGSPHNYGLTKQEQEEIQRLKADIEQKETAMKTEVERQKALEKQEMKEKQMVEWTNDMLQKKQQEIAEIEKHSLPTRHYLMKYIMPNITTSLTEVAKVRPKNAVEFLANFLLSQGDENIENNPDLDEDVVKEFRKIIKSSKCDK